MAILEVLVSEIIYENQVNGYKVCEAYVKNDDIVIVGVLPLVNRGERLIIEGNWVVHPDYGEQFSIDKFEKMSPKNIDEIYNYLISGLFKGIGKNIAKKVIKTFGEKSIEIMKNQPEKIANIPGISFDKANEYSNILNMQKELDDIIKILKEFNIEQDVAIKLYNKYESNVINMLKNNPYFLVDEMMDIDFKKIDNVVNRLSMDFDVNVRLEYGILYLLKANAFQGNTCIFKEKLVNIASEYLGTGIEEVENTIIDLFVKKIIYIEKNDDEKSDNIYLWEHNVYESDIAKVIYELSNIECEIDTIELNNNIYIYEKEIDIKLSVEQRKAVIEGIKNGLIIITGGPGTGKTTIVKFIIGILKKEGFTIKLAAPTGRAAKRLSESSSYEAQTIHRLLEATFNEQENKQYFKRNKTNPISADVIVIDEMSMIDVEVMNSFLKAVLDGTRLILVGDSDQLPSVGPGNVLKDIIKSGVAKVIRLNKIFRQAEESMIVINAHKINSQEEPILNIKDKGFYFIEENSDKDIVNTIKSLLLKRLPDRYGYDPFKDIQILSPMRKGELGIINLNQVIQESLNPSRENKDTIKFYNEFFRIGDRVMQNKNNYNIIWENKEANDCGYGIFNGDMGRITDIDGESRIVKVLLDDGKEVVYDYGNLNEIEKSYAITVHKSQGSEYPVVIIPMNRVPYMLLTKNILYTAVTRAKYIVIIVGKKTTLSNMVKNSREVMRMTSLERKLGILKKTN